MLCLNCGMFYNPNQTHWKCPYCGWKDHCCDGVSINTSGSGPILGLLER